MASATSISAGLRFALPAQDRRARKAARRYASLNSQPEYLRRADMCKELFAGRASNESTQSNPCPPMAPTIQFAALLQNVLEHPGWPQFARSLSRVPLQSRQPNRAVQAEPRGPTVRQDISSRPPRSLARKF